VTTILKPAKTLPLLGGSLIRAALMMGARAVIANRDELNRINVFPVPDGDTGTNMAFTFAAVLAGAQHARGQDASAVLHGAAMSAIDGARGNSGAIVAQFFYSLSEALKGQARVSLSALSAAITQASAGARRALSEPREGTVLSVIADFAKGLAEVPVNVGLKGFFARGLSAAKTALARTPKQLAVLAQHGVVDAGGSGFVNFLEGVQSLVEGGRRVLRAQQALAQSFDQSLPSQDHHHAQECTSRYRFCTECLLEDVDSSALRTALLGFAHDSLVFAGGTERAHLHAHTDAPAALFELAGKFGKLSQRKAEDMFAQVRARQNTARVAIVCDTAADLPPAQAERLFIHSVPVRINFGHDEFIDRITLSADQFYQRLRVDKNPVRTSQPPSGEFRRLFDQLASYHAEIVCFNISSKLSGTYQAACAAARHGGDGKTQVFDTLNAAAGEALIVLDAAEFAQRGVDAEAIKTRATAMRPRTHTFALIPDASYAARGGRLPAWLVPVTKLLRANLIIADNGSGKIVPKAVLWGRRSLAARFTQWVLARLPNDAPLKLIVGHCDARVEAEKIMQALSAQQRHHILAQYLVDAGTGIGAHAGPGALVLGVQRVLPDPH
jgi:uncharacterized protein